MDARVTDIGDFQAGGFDPLFKGREGIVGASGRGNRHVADAELFGEGEVFIGEVGSDLEGNLDAGR